VSWMRLPEEWNTPNSSAMQLWHDVPERKELNHVRLSRAEFFESQPL